MKRSVLSALAAVLLLAGGAAQASAQGMDGRIPRFDFGIYAGGALTSSWYEADIVGATDGIEEGVDFAIGYAPIFGAMATYWTTPTVGVRLHYGYMPSKPPEPSDGFFDTSQEFDGYPLNNHFYDLDLVLRPFALRPDVSRLLSSVYFFIGGGGLTSDYASGGLEDEPDFPEDQIVCEPITLARGACLALQPDAATVGQGVVGAGMHLFPLTDNLHLFGELGFHIYDSPVHISSGFTGFEEREGVSDKLAVTGRLVAGIKLLVGNQLPPPLPGPLPPPPDLAPRPTEPELREIRVCVVQDGIVGDVDALVNPLVGDTMVVEEGQRRPFDAVYPPNVGYAAGADFFVNNDPLTIEGQRYVKVGLPRIISPSQLVRVADTRGITVFGDATAPRGTLPEVVYLPIRRGCEFQAYQREQEVRGVRG